MCGNRPGGFTGISANKQGTVHSVLPRGAGTFISKALVSSGNTISSAIGALSLVFPVPCEDRKGLNLRLRRRGRR